MALLTSTGLMMGALVACQPTSGSSGATGLPSPATVVAGSPSQQDLAGSIKDWANSGGIDLLDSILSDADQFRSDSHKDLLASRDNCLVLDSDLVNAMAYKAIPDPATQAHWSKGLTAMNSAVKDCEVAAGNKDTTVVVKDDQKILAAVSEINEVASTLNELSR